MSFSGADVGGIFFAQAARSATVITIKKNRNVKTSGLFAIFPPLCFLSRYDLQLLTTARDIENGIPISIGNARGRPVGMDGCSYCYQVDGYTLMALCSQKAVDPMQLMSEDAVRTAVWSSFLAQAEEKKTIPTMTEMRTNVEYFNDDNSIIIILCAMRRLHGNDLKSAYYSQLMVPRIY